MRVFAFKYAYYNRIKCLRYAKEQGRIYTPMQKLKIFMNLSRSIDIPFLDLDVNTVCNLKCKKCAKCIPLKKGEVFSAQKVVSDLRLLLNYVDKIHVMSIIGGEPFLNNDIDEVISFCSSCNQIIDIDITTNGTIIPKDKVFLALKDSRVVVHISDYRHIDERLIENRKKFIEKLEEYKIPYVFFSQEHENWLDFGDIYNRSYNGFERGQVFYQCPLNSCTTYNDKKLYRCGRSSYLNQNDVIETVMIDVSKIVSRREMRKKIHKFYSASYLKACNYCNKKPESIVPGIQINNL